ncbi:MAG: alpha-amylase family glycosyl hydrolase [Paracoccaceae bacterium]|nr:alpha-amylase family glycosyl hydrolase [Paracoccaceae bacterium]
MWKSEGDGGFAVSSWSDIDPRFGSLSELEDITRSWRTIIDGIFNHVAWGHPIAQQFLLDPEQNADMLHAVKSDVEPEAPYAPRGGSVYLESQIDGANWYIWHTFGEQAVDINLSNDQVRAQVEAAIELYASIGVWGLRLDALGYFGKTAQNVDHTRNPGGVEVHNPDGIEISEGLIGHAAGVGLKCLLQIDSDEKVDLYKDTFKHLPAVIDYSFTAHFVFSILFQDPSRIASHLDVIREGDDYLIVRPLRTHDGILFRSRNSSDLDRSRYEFYLDKMNFQKRATNGIIYESNNSLPHLLGVQQDRSLFNRKLAAGIIIAELTATYSYIYLNALVGDEPERERKFESDPRELQRRSIDPKQLEGCFDDTQGILGELLSTLETHFDVVGGRKAYKVWAEGALLRIENEALGLSATVNFSDSNVEVDTDGEVIFSNGFNSTELDAFGLVLWQNKRKGM